MLFMIIVKSSKNSEAGNLPSPELREAMSKYNEKLVKAGVRMMAKGLYRKCRKSWNNHRFCELGKDLHLV